MNQKSGYRKFGGIIFSWFITETANGFFRWNIALILWKLSLCFVFNADCDEARFANPHWLGSYRAYWHGAMFGLSGTIAWGWPEKKFIDAMGIPCRREPRPTYHDLLMRIEELEAK